VEGKFLRDIREEEVHGLFWWRGVDRNQTLSKKSNLRAFLEIITKKMLQSLAKLASSLSQLLTCW
jgi:hypothetical protein